MRFKKNYQTRMLLKMIEQLLGEYYISKSEFDQLVEKADPARHLTAQHQVIMNYSPKLYNLNTTIPRYLTFYLTGLVLGKEIELFDINGKIERERVFELIQSLRIEVAAWAIESINEKYLDKSIRNLIDFAKLRVESRNMSENKYIEPWNEIYLNRHD